MQLQLRSLPGWEYLMGPFFAVALLRHGIHFLVKFYKASLYRRPEILDPRTNKSLM